MKLSVLASIEDENTNFNSFPDQSDYFFRVGEFAEKSGFSTIFLFKNSANRRNLITDPLLLQAALAPTVKTLRLGVGFAPFSFLDPMALADACATLDVVSHGRMTIAIDEGVRLRPDKAINLDSLQQDRQNRENRELLRTALRGDRFTTRGANRRASNIQVAVQPLQTPHPPIYTAVYDKHSAREAGAAGFRIFLSPLAALRSIEEVEAIVKAFRTGQKKADLAADQDDVIAFCLSHAGSDNKRTLDAARTAFNLHALVRPTWICRNFDEAMGLDYFLIGGPTLLARKLQRLSEIGVNHVALIPTFGGLGIDVVLDTMQIMKEASEQPNGDLQLKVANCGD